MTPAPRRRRRATCTAVRASTASRSRLSRSPRRAPIAAHARTDESGPGCAWDLSEKGRPRGGLPPALLRRPAVVVMESAQHRARHDRATRRRVIGQPWLAWDALAEPLVGAARVEVWHPFGQDPPKVILAEDQDVVEALAAEAAEEAFADGIHVGRVRRDRDHVDARAVGGVGKVAAEFAVVVPDQKPRGLLVGCGLPQLLGDPGVGREAGDVDMHDFTTAMPDDEEGEERAEPGVVELEEVAGPDVGGVVPEKCPPGLAPPGAGATGPQVLLDRPLADPEAELQELAADPLSPQSALASAMAVQQASTVCVLHPIVGVDEESSQHGIPRN